MGVDARWSRVGSFADRGGAALAMTVLADAGIDGRLEADDVGGMRPDLALVTGGVQLVVPSERAEEAHAILDDLTWRRAPVDRAARSSTRISRIGQRGATVMILVLLAAIVLSALLNAV